MHFPKHWARAEHEGFSAWRWSDESETEAKQRAQAAVAAIAEKLRAGRPEELDRYAYGDRPLREPIVATHDERNVITRNAQGCRVLNSTSALFIDVDGSAAPAPQSPGLFARLFGAKPAAPATPARPPVVAAAERWVASHPGWAFRVYRTRAGHRLLATHAPFAPEDPVCAEVFAALDADPLYARLCEVQRSFRARLSPKAWRLELREKPPLWPWAAPNDAERFRRWEQSYLAASARAAVCELITTVGNAPTHRDLASVVELHDRETRVGSGLPLA